MRKSQNNEFIKDKEILNNYEIELLKKYQIKPSIQRISILKYIVRNKTHPTIDEIFDNLVGKIPTLSKTTVYNTLNLFLKKGLAVSFLNNDKISYDIMDNIHFHFKCLKCKKIIDIDNPDIIKKFKIDDRIFDGNKVINQFVIFEGICKDCLKK